MGPRCSSAETQVCHRSNIIAAKVNVQYMIRRGITEVNVQYMIRRGITEVNVQYMIRRGTLERRTNTMIL